MMIVPAVFGLIVVLGPGAAMAKTPKGAIDSDLEDETSESVDPWDEVSESDLERQLRAARSRRNGGLVITAVGGGLGMLVGMVASIALGMCDTLGGSCDSARGLMIGGFIGAGVSLAAGIPLIVTGSNRVEEIMKQMQGRAPQVSLHLGGKEGGGQLGLTWVF